RTDPERACHTDARGPLRHHGRWRSAGTGSGPPATRNCRMLDRPMHAGSPMPALRSKIDTRSPEFSACADHHRALAAELARRLQRAAEGGGPQARQRHVARGKLPVRERIDALLDPGSPFLEIAPLAAEDMYDGAAPAAGIVCGIGMVCGQQAVVVANDATV